jgi:hypothetical protein
MRTRQRILTVSLTAAVALSSAAFLFTQPADSAPHAATIPAGDTPDGSALVRTALDRIGGKAWREIKSFESIAEISAAMGDARIEYQFIAPNAHRLVQTMPGGRGVMELGSVGGTAWMGEPGQARAVDPRMAEELAGGGDLQTLVHTIDVRFEKFETLAKTVVDGHEAWRVAMSPKAGPGADPTTAQKWTLILDASNGTILGVDIPAPPGGDGAANEDGQKIRFAGWDAVELPAAARGADAVAPDAKTADAKTADARIPSFEKILAFRTATVEAGGAKTTLTYKKVAVNTLAKDAIRVPAKIEPAPGAQ